MRGAWGLLALVGLTIFAGELPAQGIVRFGRSRGFAFSLYPGGFYGYGYPYSFSSVTVVPAYRPATVIIVVPRERLSRERDRDRERDEPPPEGVIRIRPRREREREREKEKPAKPAEPPPEPIAPPKPKEKPKPPAVLWPPPPLPPPRPKQAPPKTPLEASARYVEHGKEAFTAGEYGRAAFRFTKAAEQTPDQALPQFLLAQAYLALGKYRDAVDAIHAGLALDPAWPATGPRLRALYGPDNNEFATHLQQLDAARLQHPDDPVLLFLQGYALWFDGRQDDARPLFEKAAPLVPERKDIDRFLQRAP